MLESLPSFEPPAFPAALEFESPPDKGGGSPGNSTPAVSDVVVDLSTVELVASARVVAVVLLVGLAVVVVEALTVVLVEVVGVLVVVAAETTTTPAIPCPLWILQWYG